MGGEFIEEADMDVLPSMWPDDIGNEARKQFNMERPGVNRDMLEDVTIKDDPSVVDFKRLLELTSYSEKGSSQLAYLVKHWEYKHNNAVRLLNEELNILSKQRQEVELKKLEILEEHRFEEDSYAGSKRSVSILEDACDIWGRVPRRRNGILAYSRKLDIDADYDTVMYWKQRAMQLDKMLEESIEREHILTQKLEENIKDLETQSSPVEELSQILKRADNFLHFILQTAPIVIGHQDKELRYRFIYNHFPRLEEEDIIGKTDEEIFCGAGVKEIQDFKREVLERGSPAKREFTFDTPLFGSKTFMIYVEPVFSKAGDRIGVNYMGMDVTDQIGKLRLSEVFVRDGVLSVVDLASKSQSNPILSVARVVNSRFSDPPGSKTSFCSSPGVLTPYKASQDMVAKREKMAKLREEIAVQKAKETELNRTIHITEETMRAKQMLATMSHEIRSPLTGVVSMAEILATTKLDREQSQLLDVMLSSGDMVLQLINDILDLAKFESGAMKLEATKFRPREVVRHVLQTAAASLKKELTLEGHVADDVPVEVIGDVLRIRQILTNLISNAIKFTHEGKVGINLHAVSEQHPGCQEQHHQGLTPVLPSTRLAKKNSSETQGYIDRETSHCSTCQERPDQNSNGKHHLTNEDTEKHNQKYEKIVWLRCDVYDTGIGIPDKALPSLFKKYMQASADHARKYGGTGLGLAICKQLVELMGGNLTVTSKEHYGSTFTFVLPYKVPLKRECPDDRDEDAAISDSDVTTDYSIDEKNGSFIFKPRTWGTLFSSDESTVCKTKLSGSSMLDTLDSSNGLSECVSFSSSDCTSRTSVDGVSPISDATKTLTELKGPVQQSLGHNGNDFRRINRRDEGCQDSRNGFVMHKFNSSIMDSSGTHWISGLQQGKMASSKGANMAESGKCVPTCHSPRHEKEDNKSKCTSDRSSFKILLAEDNKINVMVAQSMMKQLGHRIDVVNNGLEAIRAVQHSRYDLILMDICMPVMDGMQATRLIRSFEEHGYWDASVSNGDDHAMACPDSLSHGPDAGRCRKRIPIIAMTANALAESAADCLANGMDSFVSKPVTFQNLKQCLQQYMPC